MFHVSKLHSLFTTYKLYNQDYELNEQFQIFFNSTFPCYDENLGRYIYIYIYMNFKIKKCENRENDSKR